MELRIDNSFEVPTQDEWNKYLGTDIFDDFRLAGGTLGETSNILQSIAHPCLHEIIQEHNNKVGSLLFADITTMKGYQMICGLSLQAARDSQ